MSSFEVQSGAEGLIYPGFRNLGSPRNKAPEMHLKTLKHFAFCEMRMASKSQKTGAFMSSCEELGSFPGATTFPYPLVRIICKPRNAPPVVLG